MNKAKILSFNQSVASRPPVQLDMRWEAINFSHVGKPADTTLISRATALTPKLTDIIAPTDRVFYRSILDQQKAKRSFRTATIDEGAAMVVQALAREPGAATRCVISRRVGPTLPWKQAKRSRQASTKRRCSRKASSSTSAKVTPLSTSAIKQILSHRRRSLPCRGRTTVSRWYRDGCKPLLGSLCSGTR